MVDIHSHVLPGLDDGPESLKESLQLLEQAIESGTTELVATPHANRRYKYDEQQVEVLLGELQARIGDRIRLYRGCDFQLDFERLREACQKPQKYWIHGGPYLLIEVDHYLPPRAMREAILQLQDAGLYPVLTHPERNPFFIDHPGELRRLVELGCLVQVTAMSLIGGFGRRSQEFACWAIEEGLVHVVASDAHHPQHRPASLSEPYAYVCRHYGQNAARVLFVENPGAVVHGRQTVEVRPGRRSFWKRLKLWG